MKQKICKKEVIMLAIVILIQTAVFIVAGMNKSYIHMDEAFSLGLANYDTIKIQNKEDFYNTWHNGEYYKDYLVVNEDEKWDFSPVYINQKNDVHPPLYYLLLRIAMNFHIDKFSIWSGVVVNIIIYIFITKFTYLIMRKLLEGQKGYKEKSAIFALVSSLLVSSINSVVYIRMYALSTLNVLITTYLHLKLLDSKESDKRLLVCIGLSALIGSLTHYYYLFYLAMLFIMFTLRYLKNKEYKEWAKYFGTFAIAGALSILIFPYSIKHMFFEYRGKGAMDNISHIARFVRCIGHYIIKINWYTFHNLLFAIILAILAICIYKKCKKIKVVEEKSKYIKYLMFPSLFYFLLVAISSPWIELRYITPICGIVFMVVMFYLEEVLNNILTDKALNVVFIIIFIVMLIMPFALHIKVQEMYIDKKEIVQKFENELNVPTLYMAKSKGVRFLDDILLFSKIDESYVSEGIDCTEENIQNIMKGKDLSKGMVVFINYKEKNSEIVETIRKALNLEKATHIKQMNACNIYYLK